MRQSERSSDEFQQARATLQPHVGRSNQEGAQLRDYMQKLRLRMVFLFHQRSFTCEVMNEQLLLTQRSFTCEVMNEKILLTQVWTLRNRVTELQAELQRIRQEIPAGSASDPPQITHRSESTVLETNHSIWCRDWTSERGLR